MTALTILPQGRVRCGEQGFIPLDQTTQLMQYETVISAPIVASDAAAGMFAWQNTSNMPFLVTSAQVCIDTAPTVGSITADVGIAATAVVSSTLMAIPATTTGTAASQNPRTATVATTGQLVLAGQWITISRTSGATAGLRGWAFFKGIYLGQVDDASLGRGSGVCPTGRVGVPDQKGFLAYSATTGYPCSSLVIEAPLSLDTSNGGAFSWRNPFDFPVLIESCILNIQTPSAAACQISVGIAATQTTPSATLISTLGIAGAAVNASPWSQNATSLLSQSIVPGGQWITGTYVSGVNTGFVGRINLSVLPMGTVIN